MNYFLVHLRSERMSTNFRQTNQATLSTENTIRPVLPSPFLILKNKGPGIKNAPTGLLTLQTNQTSFQPKKSSIEIMSIKDCFCCHDILKRTLVQFNYHLSHDALHTRLHF